MCQNQGEMWGRSRDPHPQKNKEENAMERFRKKLAAFVIVLAASVTLVSLPVMAKTNSKPATINKPLFVYVNEEGEPTGTQVKGNKLTLVKGTDQEEVTIKADATLKNALPSDQLVVRAANASGVVITPSENNVFTIKGVSATNKTVVEFTYTVSNNATKNKQKSAPEIGQAKEKVVKLNVKVVEEPATVELEGGSMNLSDNGVAVLPPTSFGDEEYIVGTASRRIGAFEIDTTGAKSTKNNKDVYTIPITIPVTVSGNTNKTKFVFTTTNKNAATFSGKMKNGILTGTIKVKRDAFTNDDGMATAVIGVGVKSTEIPFGNTKVYGKSDYIKLYIKPNALGNKIKLTGASPVVAGKKTKNAAFVIPAGKSEVEAEIGAVYSSNGGKVSVVWDEVQDENKGYTITNNNNNTATLTVLKPFKSSDKIELKGTVKSLNENDETVKTANLKLKITATKKVDKVVENPKSKGTGKKGLGEADGSTYYGTNMRSMWINGNREKVRTFYYLAPTKNFAESFSIEALPDDVYKQGVAQGAINNIKLVAVKDVSDSEKNNKSTVSVKQDKGKNSFTATLNVKKPSAKDALTDEELVIYQIAAADSKNVTTGQYEVGRYVAISVNPKQADKDVEIKIDGSTSGNKIIAKGKAETITVSANKEVPYTIESRDDDVVIVQVDENKYEVYGANTGDTYVDARIAGVNEPKASLHVFVVGFDDMTDKTMYPGEKNETLGKVALNIAGAAATVSVNAIDNGEKDKPYITISGNATLKNGESSEIKVLSANRIGEKGSPAKVKVEATAVFTILGMDPVTITKSATVTVNPYTVELDKDSYTVDTAEAAIPVKAKVAGRKDMLDAAYKIEVKPSTKTDENFCTISGNSATGYTISGNFAGTGIITATYKDVNGAEYKDTAQLVVTDKGGTKTYKDETVISFNAVKKAEAGINNVEITTEGGTDTIKKAYHRFLENLKKVPKDEEVKFTLTISGDSTISKNNAEQASGAEEPAEASEAQDAEEVKTEEPAAEAGEAVSVNEAEEAASATEAEEAVSTNTAEEAVSVNEAEEAEVPAEAEAEENKETAEAEVPETAKTEEIVEEAEGTDTVTKTVSQDFVIEVKNGEPTVKPSENAVDQFIYDNFDEVSVLKMKITLDTVDKTIPNLLGIADQALSDKKQQYSKTVRIKFSDGETIELKDIHFDEGLYCIGNTDKSDKFAIKGNGDKTVVVYKGKINADTAGGRLVKKAKNIGNLIAGIEYYDNDGKKDTSFKF